MLPADDADGFNDRQLFDFPPERNLHFDEFIPVPHDVPHLYDILKTIMQQHSHEASSYCFTAAGLDSFKLYHDILVDQKAATDDEDVQGVLSKARGYIARTAMVLHCLEQAVERQVLTSTEDSERGGVDDWELCIGPHTVSAAAKIINHLNQQKLIIVGKDGSTDKSTSLDGDSTCSRDKVKRVLTSVPVASNGLINPSTLGQKHISEKVGSSYPVKKAIELLKKVSEMGFGEMVDVETPTKRKVSKFRKRQLQDLPDNAVTLLKKLKITDEEYSNTFNSSPLAAIDGNVPSVLCESMHT